jgi:predicted nucleic acid-binding protein
MLDIFLDTDVVIDIISQREPHYHSSAKLMRLALEDKIGLIVAECSLANLFYFTFDAYKIEKPSVKLLNFLSACEIAHGGKGVILNALNSAFKDKEDALQYFTALDTNAEYFITRNTADYKHAIRSLPVYTPAQFIELTAKLNI